eukprot:UN32428
MEPMDTSVNNYQIEAKRIIKDYLNSFIKKKPDDVHVITGFIGHIQGGIIEGVGRGYSDLTSALVAAALNVSALQVWKESDGVFTGNPTKIDTARLLQNVTPREVSELTHFGNEVLHPYTVECAMNDKIPIHIKNTFKPESKGTVIDPINGHTGPPSKPGMTAICSKRHIKLINLTSSRKLDTPQYLATLFQLFAKHNVKIDLIST